MNITEELERIDLRNYCEQQDITFKFTQKYKLFIWGNYELKAWSYSRFFKLFEQQKVKEKGNYDNLLKLLKEYFENDK